MDAAVLMAELMHDLRIMHPPVPVVTGDCIALPLPGEASLVILELEPHRLVSFGYKGHNQPSCGQPQSKPK